MALSNLLASLSGIINHGIRYSPLTRPIFTYSDLKSTSSVLAIESVPIFVVQELKKIYKNNNILNLTKQFV